MTNKNSLLWEIHDETQLKGYLFGTMHVSGEIAFSDFSNIYQAIDKCDVLATEISLDPESQKAMGMHMHLPKDVSLKNLLSEKKFLKYGKILKKSYGIDIEIFNTVLPLFLINYITQLSLDIPKDKLHVSMDLQCYQYAVQSNKITDSVESLEDHVNTLYNIPIDYQVKALKQALSDVSKFRMKSKRMLSLYQSQKVHELYKQSKKSLAGIKSILLFHRNEVMLSNIFRIFEHNSAFIAVGAGHLSGKKGLIHGLKKRGYQLRPSHIKL